MLIDLKLTQESNELWTFNRVALFTMLSAICATTAVFYGANCVQMLKEISQVCRQGTSTSI